MGRPGSGLPPAPAAPANLFGLLAPTNSNLGVWLLCSHPPRAAFRRGALDREDQNYIVLGNCLLEATEYDAARKAFQTAARDERSRGIAENWLSYLNSEEARVIALRDMVRVR
jgi:hypothetical protein